MGSDYAGGIFLVTATKDGKTEYWAAATPSAYAVDAVRAQIAPGWKLALTGIRLTTTQVAELNMRPDSVRKLKDAP